MVSHERLAEPLVTMKWLLAKPRSFSNLPAFLDLYDTWKMSIENRKMKRSPKVYQSTTIRVQIFVWNNLVLRELLYGLLCGLLNDRVEPHLLTAREGVLLNSSKVSDTLPLQIRHNFNEIFHLLNKINWKYEEDLKKFHSVPKSMRS